MSNSPATQTQKTQLLQFNVAQLLKQVTDASRRYSIENAALPNLDPDIVLLAPLNGSVKLVKTGDNIFVTGRLTTIIKLPCTRCLEPVQAPITVDIEETFSPVVDIFSGKKLAPPNNADAAILLTEHHLLDLTEVVRQGLFLSRPSRILCRPDCRGLCPVCGQNKNQADCNCRANHVDARWAGLLAHKQNLDTAK